MKSTSLKSTLSFLLFIIFLLFMVNPVGVYSFFSRVANKALAYVNFINPTQLKVLIFGFVIAAIWYLYQRGTKHIRLERQLPTSKIGSVTVGLAEIRGKTRAINTCFSPWTKTECIAYRYEKQRVSLKDGRVKTVVLESQTDVMPFELVDDTGHVLVDIDELEILGVPAKFVDEPNTDITHKEFLLLSGFDGLLIGRATPQDGKIVVRKDETHGVFNLSNYATVLLERRQAPMVRILGAYTLVTLVILGFVINA